MAITQTSAGTVENNDVRSITINRNAGGVLTATGEYEVTSGPRVEIRSATWLLTAAEKTTIGGLLPGVKAAIAAAEGL